jgi:hypothetical protein
MHRVHSSSSNTRLIQWLTEKKIKMVVVAKLQGNVTGGGEGEAGTSVVLTGCNGMKPDGKDMDVAARGNRMSHGEGDPYEVGQTPCGNGSVAGSGGA